MNKKKQERIGSFDVIFIFQKIIWHGLNQMQQ